MHVAIVAAPGHGHVNPLLPIAAALARRGERVTFAASTEFADAVEATGAALLPMGDRFPPPVLGGDRVGAVAHAARRAWLGQVGDAIRSAIARVTADRPDVLVYDAAVTLMGLADVADVPVRRVAVFPTFAVPEGISLRDALPIPDRDGRSAMLPAGTMPARAEGLNIVTIPRSYQLNADAFDERYLFVGPSLRDEPDAASFPLPPADGRPLVYVSLGTAVSDQPAFYRAAFAALAARPWRAVVATGRADPASLGPIPPTVVAQPFVPQIAVLREADLFVTHGGMNSTMEALRLGVPLVVVPGMGDQFLNARRVEDLRLGRSLEGVEPTPTALLEAADAVLADAGYRARAASLRHEMDGAGGAKRAADAIQRYAAAGSPSSDAAELP